MDESITLEEYYNAYNILTPFIKNTNLIKYKNNIYLKKESQQYSGSFKWYGVLYSVICEFEKILKHKTKNFYLVTQSTGNHGIAVIAAVNEMIQHYSFKYPEYKDIWNSVTPCIFTSKHILPSKLKKMKKKLRIIVNNKGFIDNSYNNYEDALNARINFLNNNKGTYLEHGGKTIMTGYGTIAFKIHEQLPKNKSISLYVAVGAGGPIGIGHCLSLLRNTKIIINQTYEFNAFIKSLKHNKIYTNDCNVFSDISDGIAVDKPEEFALHEAKKLNYTTVEVETEDVKKIKNKIKLNNSTCISLCGLKKCKIDSDYIVVLECE